MCLIASAARDLSERPHRSNKPAHNDVCKAFDNKIAYMRRALTDLRLGSFRFLEDMQLEDPFLPSISLPESHGQLQHLAASHRQHLGLKPLTA